MRSNWKTTLSGISAAFMALLAMLAALPYELGDVATIIPPDWKPRVTSVSIIAAFLLRVINSLNQADKPPVPPAAAPQVPPSVP